jgi:hypothetical protein
MPFIPESRTNDVPNEAHTSGGTERHPACRSKAYSGRHSDEKRPDKRGIQTVRVIVDIHREQASLLQRTWAYTSTANLIFAVVPNPCGSWLACDDCLTVDQFLTDMSLF